MSEKATYFESFDAEPDFPKDGILSRTVLDTDAMRLVLFQFAEGQELSEHTAALPAVIQIVSGTARLTLGEDEYQAHAGAFVYMPANLTHAVYASTPLVMLLQLIKGK